MADYKERIGDLPMDWEVVKGNSQLILESGMRPAEHVTDNPNDIPSLGGENIDLNGYLVFDNIRYISKEYYAKMPKGKIEDGDILINKDGANTGKIAFAKSKPFDNCAVNEHVFLIRNKGEFDQEFLFYFLFSDKGNRQIQRKIVGSAQGGINNSFPKGMFIPKPPIHEQKAIATILSKVDEAIKATENSIKAAEKLKKSLMQNLLTGKLKPDGTWRKEDEFYKDEKFGNVPVGWEVKRVEQLVNRRTDNFDPLKSSESLDYVGLEHILPNEFRREGVGKSDETLALKIKFFIGDVLLGKLRPYLNKVWIADLNGVGSTEFLVFEGNKYSKWVYLNFQSKRFLDFTQSVTAGTQHPRASYRDVKRFLLSVPKDDNEMDLITNAIISTEKLKDDKLVRIKMLQRLKKSLMQNLLTGKVRVDLSKIENILNEI